MACEHSWFLCRTVRSPPVDIFDCGCGARRKVFYYHGLQPEIVDVTPDPRGSMFNCLEVGDGGMQFDSALGDPQGDRMRQLVAQNQSE